MKAEVAEMDMLLQPDGSRRLEELVTEHVTELTLRRKQLSIPYNAKNDATSWSQEVDFFIEEIISPQVAGIKATAEQVEQIRQSIDISTAHYPMSRVFFAIDKTPFPFEHRVADALEELGWLAGLTNGEGERGLDATATMREKQVVIRCLLSSSAIGHCDVQKAFDDISSEGTDYIAIVSNADFTPHARQLAMSLRVLLLHYDELTRLEESLFGTDAWRSAAQRIAPVVQAEQQRPSSSRDGQAGRSAVHAA